MNHEPTSFARTMRALDASGISPALLAVILVAGLGGVWTGWLITARVPVYQVSAAARLEVERVYPIAAPVAGRIVSTSLVLGREVQQGDVLLEVEADRERLETSEERARADSLGSEIHQLNQEMLAEEEAIEDTRRAARAGVAEASQRSVALEAALQQAQDRQSRLTQLERQGLVSVADAEIARGEERARRSELAAARAGIERLQAEQTAAERTRRARLTALGRERIALAGRRTATQSLVTRRERETERRRIRAPVAGRLGEVNPVQIGAIIRDGEVVGSIVPSGRVRVVAEFAPPALGRLRNGQTARLRLDGFPWTQYGYVTGTVTSVASETRQQRVRVELAVRPVPESAIPLQHGMPGVVEVEVERVAPMLLLVRSLGQAISGPVAARADEPPRADGLRQ